MIRRQTHSCVSPKVDPLKLKLLDEYLLPGSCLDIGCGNGLYGRTMLERCAELLQIDLVDRRSPEARQYPFRIMDANQLDLPQDSFDNVVAFDIMEHLDDDAAFLRHVLRICRGRFICSVPNADDEQPRIIALTHMHHVDKTHRREYTVQSLTALLQDNSLNVLEIRPHYNRGLFHASMALAKRNVISRLVARTISWQMQLYETLGLFENRCIADWFCAAGPSRTC